MQKLSKKDYKPFADVKRKKPASEKEFQQLAQRVAQALEKEEDYLVKKQFKQDSAAFRVFSYL